LEFIEAKCAAGRAYDLAADYNAALTAKGFKRERHPAVEEFGRFVRSQSRTLAARPGLVYQQAANEPDRSSPARSAAARWRREAEEPWLRLLNKTGKGSHHLMRLVGHSSAVDGCSFSPDGHKILSESWDGTLKLWDAGTGEELVTMGDTSFHDHPVAAAFEPGGTRILSAHSEGRVRLWDSASGAELSSVIGKWREVLTCGFIEGRERFIALSRPLGWFLKLRDAQTGESLITLRSFGRKVRISALSPDGSLIASALHKRLNLWNARSGNRVFVRGRFRDRIENCGFSGDGTRVFASDKNEARIWDTSSGTELSTLAKVRNMALSPDGKRAVAFKYSEIDLCYTANGKKLAALRGHTEWVRACAFSPDGKRFVSASNDNTVMVWEAMSRPRDRVTIEREPEAFVDPSDLGFRKRMHTTPALDPLFWDGLTGGKKRAERLSFSSYSYNTKLFSPDSTRVALISNDDAALWDARLDKRICDLATRKGKLVCACFSLDGRLLVTGSQDHTLKIWDSRTGAKLGTLSGHTFWVDDCVFALDGSRIISISTDGTRMWDPGSGRELTNFGDRVHALSPDGQCALTSAYEYNSSSDRETVSEQVARTLIRVKICDLVSGRVITSFPEPWGEIEEAAFSPDGKWILAACRDEPVTLRDASTGRVLCEYPTSCEQVQWAPDGKRFLAVSRNSSDLFQVENLSPGPLIVTAWVDPSTGSCAAGCPVCRRWPEVAVADAGCETECSHCHQSLLLNRFLIRADWQSVAAAWQTTNPKKLTRSARS
ncbi:MAG: WD40 repeat domain-containing protein, partial [Blastocatellia bacterium]